MQMFLRCLWLALLINNRNLLVLRGHIFALRAACFSKKTRGNDWYMNIATAHSSFPPQQVNMQSPTCKFSRLIVFEYFEISVSQYLNLTYAQFKKHVLHWSVL
jgi:hypothetical protein